MRRSTKDNSNVRNLLVEAAGTAPLWSNYHAGGAAVGETKTTSGTCWLRLHGRHTCGVYYYAGGAAIEETTAKTGTCWCVIKEQIEVNNNPLH